MATNDPGPNAPPWARKRPRPQQQQPPQSPSPRPKKPRKDKGCKHQQPESKLQVACVAWADAQDLLVDGSPGGAAFMKGAHKARGCKPGRADLLVLEPGGDGAHGLAVELKIGTKYGLRDSQRQWLEHAQRKGWRTGIAHSLAGFQELVREHVRPRGTSAADPLEVDCD